MNRTVWLAVGVIALLFLLTSLLPLGGIRPDEASALWGDDGAGAGSLWDRVAPYLGTDLGALGWTLLGIAGAVLSATVARVLLRSSGKERRRARRLARRGRPTAEIARRMRLSQDAVRTLLDPGPARRSRSAGFGNFFRSAGSSAFRKRSRGAAADQETAGANVG